MRQSYKHRMNIYHNIKKIKIHAVNCHSLTLPKFKKKFTAIKVLAP